MYTEMSRQGYHDVHIALLPYENIAYLENITKII